NVFHGSYGNENTVGIEHANVENGWTAAIDTTPGGGNTRVPDDHNRYFHLGRAFASAVHWGTRSLDYQAYQDEQDNSMTLMLRAICIEQRIPRQFFGETWVEKVRRYVTWVDTSPPPHHPPHWVLVARPPTAEREALTQITSMRGIIRHSNLHADKS